MGLNFIRTPKGQRFISENLGAYMAGADTGPQADIVKTVTARAFNEMLKELTSSPEDQTRLLGNAMPKFTWKDIVRNPDIRSVVARDPRQTEEAMRKAADHTAWVLESQGIKPEDLIIDHTQLGNAFKIKGQAPMKDRPNWQQSNTARIDPQKQLNETYMQIISTFGARGVGMWLEHLGLTNVAKKQQGTSEPKKKVSSGASQYTKPTEYDGLISQAAEQAGVDPIVFKVLLGTESSFQPGAVSPRLDPNVAIPKAASILAQYLKASGGDYREAMMKYKGAVSEKGRASMAPIIDSILEVSSG
jgi:hypothetical protein